MKLRVTSGVFGGFIKWSEDIDDVFFEGVHLTIGFVHAKEPWDLNEPSYVVRDQFVVYDPSREFVPLID